MLLFQWETEQNKRTNVGREYIRNESFIRKIYANEVTIKPKCS